MKDNLITTGRRNILGLRSLFKAAAAGIVLLFGSSVMWSGVAKKASTYSPEFEKAVTVIKKYEGMHRNKGQLIGYGHKVIAGDKYKRNANLSEAQADALLREDLKKLCAKYRSFGKDSLLLSALAYNCGIGVVAKSSIYKNLKSGSRDVKAMKESYLAHCRYRGKVHRQIKQRRIEEFETLFIP